MADPGVAGGRIDPEARRLHDLETLRHIITQWNANRLDLFELSLPNEELEFTGVMRFYYQAQDLDSGQKVATKCIRVSSTATTKTIVEILIEKFRPDMKMLEVPEYALYEIHESGIIIVTLAMYCISLCNFLTKCKKIRREKTWI